MGAGTARAGAAAARVAMWRPRWGSHQPSPAQPSPARPRTCSCRGGGADGQALARRHIHQLHIGHEIDLRAQYRPPGVGGGGGGAGGFEGDPSGAGGGARGRRAAAGADLQARVGSQHGGRDFKGAGEAGVSQRCGHGVEEGTGEGRQIGKNEKKERARAQRGCCLRAGPAYIPGSSCSSCSSCSGQLGLGLAPPLTAGREGVRGTDVGGTAATPGCQLDLEAGARLQGVGSGRGGTAPGGAQTKPHTIHSGGRVPVLPLGTASEVSRHSGRRRQAGATRKQRRRKGRSRGSGSSNMQQAQYR